MIFIESEINVLEAEEIVSMSHIVLKFNEYIENNLICELKLADKMGITRNHLQRVLRGKGTNARPLSENIRQKINKVLGTNF